MDIERPHRTPTTTTSELFICFTSRLSKSSSMRLSSKSILSPARTTSDKTTQPASLSTSLSRRLRHNGSLRGAQSPAMFPSKKSRGGSGFADNPEPSSPKVTCIGQVRVKTKKQGKKMKMRACRSKRLSGGEASFRRIEHPLDGTNANANAIGIQSQQSQDRNQRWVHLPLTICEALRAFGNEFSCLLPCKSSCFSGGEKGGKSGEERENGDTSCAVFRWLVSLQEGEGKRRDIELVVGGGEEEQEQVVRGGESIVMEREGSRRRSIFDDMEFDDLFKNEGEIFKDNNGGGDDENNGRRVSLCIPPKNALLLMRCRSDPVKMASLSHKLWDVAPLPAQGNVDDDGGDDEEDDKDGDEEERVECEMNEVKLEETIQVAEDKKEEIEEEFVEERVEGEKTEGMLDVWVEVESNPEDLPCFIEEDDVHQEEKPEEILVEEEEQNQGMENTGKTEDHDCEILEEISDVVKDVVLGNGCSLDENEQDLSSVNVEEQQEQVNEEVKESLELDDAFVEKSNVTALEKEVSTDVSTTTTTSSCSNSSEESTAESKEREEEKDPIEEENDSIEVQQQEEEQVQQLQVQEPRKSMEEKPKENNTKPTLPDCLLLMMCEPKVSMEVSKETWVCTTDFLKWLPERHPKKVSNKLDGSDESTKKKKLPPIQPSAQRLEPPAQVPVQPGRSSISFPAGGVSVANMIEQKLVKGGAGGYEPLVLTRCKSAPMRSGAAKIAPSEMTCSLWGRENGRKLEPHRPATFGVGAAGVGF